MTTSISLHHARAIAIRQQLLDRDEPVPQTKDGALEIISTLGYVQIDTLAVVERAHHHTLWTRQSGYDPQYLHELQAEDRKIFEYWGHAASFLPMEDYRYYIPLMKQYFDPVGKWEKDRLDKYGHLMPDILKQIEERGAMGSKDFAPASGKKTESWWDWHPLKTALELLFWRGDLMITKRHNFQRIYDLTERVLPDYVNTQMPTDKEVAQFLVNRALQSLGIATLKEIKEHIRVGKKDVIDSVLKEMIKSGEVIEVSIESLDDVYYSQPALLDVYPTLKTLQLTHILSPFDNLIIQRDRIKKLFGFDYAIECYVPAPKRQYGYFVLPVLWGERFVCRFDVKADRKRKALMLKNIVFEADFIEYSDFLPYLSDKLSRFARFNGCESIEVDKVSPAKFKRSLISKLKKIGMIQ